MMVLLGMNGFDDSVLELGWLNSFFTPSYVLGRDGIGQCIQNSGSNGSLTWTLNTSAITGNTYYLGYATRVNSLYTSGSLALISVSDNTSTTTILTLNTDGTFNVGNGPHTRAILTANAWVYIELSIQVNASNWTCSLAINNQIIISNQNVSSNSTYNFNHIVFKIGQGASSNTQWIDDVYLADNTGTVNNTFLGDCYVRTMLPIGNGASSQFTNSAGTSVDNYSYVDEQNSSSTDYVGATTPGLEDLYTILDGTHPIPNDYVVHGIQGLVYAGKSDTGTPPNLSYTGKGAVGTVRKDAVNFNLGTGYTSQNSVVQTTDPDGNALTPATVNNMQIGVVTS